MTTLYVRRQGARINRNGERLRITFEGDTLQDEPIRDLDQVAVYGNVQMTTQAAALLVRNEVDVVFFSMYGRFRYRLQDSGSRFARVRQAQLRLLDDGPRSLKLAQSIVQGKLANQRQLLLSWAEDVVTPGVERQLYSAADGVQRMAQSSVKAQSLDALRGYEGKAAALYFGAMRALVPPTWHFQGRAFYPPPDPWNAVLSFGYSLLLKDVTAAVQMVGLDPFVGFFHALEANRPSLVLDLMEEFRPMVDETAMRLLAHEKLPLERFRTTPDPKRPVEMGPDLLPVLIDAYETRLSQIERHTGGDQRTPLRRCLELQVREVAAVILGRQPRYRSLRMQFAPVADVLK